MERETEIEYFKMAMNMQQIFVDDENADRILETFDRIKQKGGKFTVKDAVEINHQIKEKYDTES